MVIPMQSWRTVRPELIRKKRMVARQVNIIRQQQAREQQAQAKYYGDNLK